METEKSKELRRLALKIRMEAMREFRAAGSGHIGGVMSIADTIAALYGGIMRIDPKRPDWEDRDKLVCSKGHAGPAVYAALALKGFFPLKELETLNQPGTRLPSHCDRQKTPGIDMTTGSLGQGGSLAAGLALGEKIKGKNAFVYVIFGDGELDEGQIWESVMFSAAHRLDNLVFLIDENKKQLDGTTEEVLSLGDIESKFRSFGCQVRRVKGNDPVAVYEALEETKQQNGQPHALILDTIKGAGIPWVETLPANHHLAISREQADETIDMLQKQLNEV